MVAPKTLHVHDSLFFIQYLSSINELEPNIDNRENSLLNMFSMNKNKFIYDKKFM